MYATATAPSMFAPRNASNTYHQIGIQTGVSNASAHQLTTMLFNGALDSIAQAKGAVINNQVELKCRAISKCIDIIDQGLRASLNLQDGGDLAKHLNDLYGYITMRLAKANLHNDLDALDECARLLTPVRDAWIAIAPTDASAVRAAMEIRA